MKIKFFETSPKKAWNTTPPEEWTDWHWQQRKSLKEISDFELIFDLSDKERNGFAKSDRIFKTAVTPYYASLASSELEEDPIRRIFMPTEAEMIEGAQQMRDPLGETQNQITPRLIHRYSDRVLLWVTDTCGIYCRYCLRKHFTATGQATISESELESALTYIRSKTGIREVILSGGDPLTLSDSQLENVLERLREIDHIEIIRIGSRMPVVNPFRLTENLAQILKKYNPVFLMTHFNHPREVTQEAFQGLTQMVDNGIPVFNQMVLLNGVNNHPAIVQALSRRLLFARVKPYYMFQCDPSMGTDHLRNSVEDSLEIQRELWGHLSGLAMPNLSLDVPRGGGKVPLYPNFQVAQNNTKRTYTGWDGVTEDYISPPSDKIKKPIDVHMYLQEWDSLKGAKLSQDEHI